MADLYFYKGTSAQQETQILCHMDSPAGNNNQGIPWSTAVLLSGYSSGKSVMPSGDGTNGTIDAAEREALAVGTRLEFVMTFSTSKDGNLTIANARTLRTAEILRITAEITQQLNNFGFAGS